MRVNCFSFLSTCAADPWVAPAEVSLAGDFIFSNNAQLVIRDRSVIRSPGTLELKFPSKLYLRDYLVSCFCDPKTLWRWPWFPSYQ